MSNNWQIWHLIYLIFIRFNVSLYFFVFFRHVQVNNEGAIEFYKKFGFEIVETKEHYYKRIEPADAHVLQKTLRKREESSNNSKKSSEPHVNGLSHPT